MSEFKHEHYRDSLARDLKTIEDHDERAEALESEQGSWRYITAKEKHLLAIGQHPEKMRLARLKEIAEEKMMGPEVKSKVESILKKIESDGRPFPEHESYYSRSSHSSWYQQYADFKWIGQDMRGDVKHAAERSTESQINKLPTELNKFTIVGYVLSAVSDEIDYRENPNENPDRWFHLPLEGAKTSLDDEAVIYNEGKENEYTEFGRDEDILSIQNKVNAVMDLKNAASVRDERGVFSGYDKEKMQAVYVELQNLKDELIKFESQLGSQIIATIDLLTQRLEEEESVLQKEA